MDQLLQFRIHEAVGDHLLVAFVDEHGLHALHRQIRFAVAAHDQTRLHRLIRNAVVAVDTRHLFDQVLFDLHIETPARRNRLPLILAFGHLTAQTAENVAYLLVGNMVANQAIQFAAAQGDGCALRQRCFVGHIDNRTGFTAADIQQQARCTLHRFILQRRVNAALIAVGGIGVQAVTAGATGN